MKLSEMSTTQMAECMTELVVPVNEIVADTELWDAVSEANDEQKTRLQNLGNLAVKVVPLLLRKHLNAFVKVLSVMTGKTEEEIKKQKGVQTIADVKDCLDKDLMDFFKPSASTENAE